MSPSVFDHQDFLKHVTSLPGVYQMYDCREELLYVGKAKNLKKRLASYFRRQLDSPKTRVLVSQIAAIQVTVTQNEAEALLLEYNLIKQHRPRYNVLLRDDKSYPYILITKHEYPRVSYHRGAQRQAGRYFGPYPSAHAVKETLNLLQKLFQVRQCEDSFFKHRSRPCLQHQIKRCSAPCVKAVAPEQYADDVRHTEMFLAGKNQAVIDELAGQMEQASEQLAFEQAAMYRDQISHLRQVHTQQYVSRQGGQADVIALSQKAGVVCIAVLFIRQGRVLGSKTFFPKPGVETEPGAMLEAFILQFYLNKRSSDGIDRIYISHSLESPQSVNQVLQQHFQHSSLQTQPTTRSEPKRWLQMAQRNADSALAQHLASKSNMLNRFEALQDVLQLDELPRRIECFDISHSHGEATVASCVVFELSGAVKNDYRRFNIKDITPGDDYAAMKQALTRRYTRLKSGEGKLPDILLVDGGKGQLTQAQEVLTELQVTDVLLVGVAKGITRKPGLETLFVGDKDSPMHLGQDEVALHLIQQVRDEAHRFAITGHRQRRDKARSQSTLEGVAGIGPKRRRELLRQFGGLQAVAQATVEELAKAPGISPTLAQRIYDHFHDVA